MAISGSSASIVAVSILGTPASNNYNQNVSSTISSTTTVVKQPRKILSSVINSSSVIRKYSNKLLSSIISSSSALVANKSILRSLTASVSLSTSIIKAPRKILSGSVGITATFTRIFNKSIASILTFNSGYGLRFYGTGSGNIDRVRLPLDTDGVSTSIDVGADDFTIESWIQFDRANNTANISGGDARNSNIFWDRDIWGHPRGWVVGLTGTGTTRNVCFGMAEAAGDTALVTESTTALIQIQLELLVLKLNLLLIKCAQPEQLLLMPVLLLQNTVYLVKLLLVAVLY
ncbi:MAG: hypothetical protein HC874_30475 [Richelia sp. SL_2_1]|nr:hypothetical protein [Richelia sp. SL_2_1]